MQLIKKAIATNSDRPPVIVRESVRKGLIGSSVDVGIPRVVEFRKVDFRNGAKGNDCRTFKNADEAASELLRKGFKRTDSDPDYPFGIVWSDGVGMKARLEWSDLDPTYVVVGVKL